LFTGLCFAEALRNAGELERSSGIEGERLQMAFWLELCGRVDRSFDLEEEPTRSFSCVGLRKSA
jgi:hypothetical protein